MNNIEFRSLVVPTSLDHPDAAAEWMSAAGFGVYPTVFVGTLAHITSIEAAD